MQPDYIQLNTQAEIAAENVQRQINDQIQYTPALKEMLGGHSHAQGFDYQAGRVAVDRAIDAVGKPVCSTLGNTLGAGLGGLAGAGVGMAFPAVELPAILIGAKAGSAATEYTCNLTVKALGRTAWGKAYQAKADTKLNQAKEELSAHYDRIHAQTVQQLIDGKDANAQAYLQDQYYRSIKQQPFYGMLPDQKKQAIDQERVKQRAALTTENASFQAKANQHDAIDKVTENYLTRVSIILNSVEINSPPPSPKTVAENQAFLKEFKAENTQMNAQTHRLLNAVLHEQKIYNQELKKLNAHNDEQAKKENALAQYKGMEAGFNMIGQIGIATGNETVAKIGSVGAAGVSIAANVAMLSGAIPGVALTGWGMMIPYAGIALAGLAIITTLFGKKKSKDDPTLQALRAISEQIENLRREMHELFRQLSLEIKDEFLDQEVLIIKLNNLIKVMLSDGFETINFKLDEIQGDLERLTRLTNKGHSAIYLQDFIRTVDAISDYVQVDGNRERELEKELIALHSWMSNPERIHNTNAHWAMADMTDGNPFDATNSKDHHTLLGETALSLGYLSKLSSLMTGVQFNGVDFKSIPNVGLFIKGIETYVMGRRKMGAPAAHVMDPQKKHLIEIKARAENALQWMTQLRAQEHVVLKGLRDQYFLRAHQMEEAIYQAGINRLDTGLLTRFEISKQDALDMTLLWPQEMISTEAGYPNLAFDSVRQLIETHKNNLKMPQLLQNAQKKFGVGKIVAYYTPIFTPARANCVFVGNRTNHNNVIGRTAGYQISLNYEVNGHRYPLYTCSGSYHEPDTGVTPLTMKDKYGGPGRDNYLYENAAAAKNNLSRPDFFANSWASATIENAVGDHTKQALTIDLIHTVNTGIMNNVIAAPQWPEDASVILEAIKAHRELLGTLPDELTYMKGLWIRFASLLGHPSLERIMQTWDNQAYFDNANIYKILIGHINQLIDPQLISARTGDAVPTHPIEQQFKYVIAWVDYLIAYEAQALLNQRNDLVNELQVDEALVYDPNRIGNNQIIDANLLGRGSFGQVYRVTDGDQTLAVKVFYPGAGLDASARREIDVACRLNQADQASDFIVRILGATRIPDRGNALVMEYVANGTLEAHLHERDERLPVEHEMRITQEMVRGLKFLHDHNIIHNDFKSANVLLTEDYHVKISDYGISRVIGATQRSTTRRQTTTSQMSTLAYRAPELVYDARRQPDQKSDIYSLAVVMWELISRCRPYHETDGQDITILSILMGLKATPDTANDHLTSSLVTPLANLMRDASKRVPEQRIGMDEITTRLSI